jgi:folate-dependent phosphoribosylglycinamide formyltransferase PurN
MTQQEVQDLLNKVDATTSKIGSNVQTIADVDQKISDEIDAFLAANPAGTVLTDAMVTQLQAHADTLQKSSDASDAQVAVLQAIAAKGAPVVPPPPPPPVV